ncbi:MAG: glycosyltransferase family 39 protein [Dehalococcoidia bacterium]|nr:glycosyltransferase family 39 protein [Dehalococcoidia bacterium]
MSTDVPATSAAPARRGVTRPGWLTNAIALDLAFVAAIAAVALVLRVVGLGGLPAGLHGDEASTGLDARKILAGQSVWPYTPSALGQPSAPMYWAAVWVKLLGSTAVAVRLPMALIGVGTVVLGFFALRELFGRPAAYAGAILLAFSSWLIFYNRTGFTASAMPFTELASVLALAVALRKGTWPWFLLAGAVVGAGIYGYFAYPLFVVGLAAWVVVYAAVQRPRPWWPFVRNVLVTGLTALLVIQPMWPYATSRDAGYRHDRRDFAVNALPAYKAASTSGKIDLYWKNAKRVFNALREGGHPDASDGSGGTAALDPLLITLAAAGVLVSVVLAIARRRAAYLLPLVVAPFVLIGPVWSVGSPHRRALGILPFVVMPAAVALGAGWEWFASRGRMAAASAVVALTLVAYGGLNVYRYFVQTPGTDVMVFTFAPQLSNTVAFMRAQPPGTRIYFVSERWSANYETVQYLLPGRRIGDGTIEDRSTRFARPGAVTGYGNIDRTKPALIVLVDRYEADAATVASRYPDANRTNGPAVNGARSFIAFSLPPTR